MQTFCVINVLCYYTILGVCVFSTNKIQEAPKPKKKRIKKKNAPIQVRPAETTGAYKRPTGKLYNMWSNNYFFIYLMCLI